jgi:hypothetical protein
MCRQWVLRPLFEGRDPPMRHLFTEREWNEYVDRGPVMMGIPEDDRINEDLTNVKQK